MVSNYQNLSNIRAPNIFFYIKKCCVVLSAKERRRQSYFCKKKKNVKLRTMNRRIGIGNGVGMNNV